MEQVLDDVAGLMSVDRPVTALEMCPFWTLCGALMLLGGAYSFPHPGARSALLCFCCVYGPETLW